MSYSDLQIIGATKSGDNEAVLTQLFKCAGFDTNFDFSQYALCDSSYFRPDVTALVGEEPYDVIDCEEFEPLVLAAVIIKLFPGTAVFYAEQTTIFDTTEITEKIYRSDISKKRIISVCFDEESLTVNDEFLYDVIRDECESAAKKAGVEPEWIPERGIYPVGDEFEDMCFDLTYYFAYDSDEETFLHEKEFFENTAKERGIEPKWKLLAPYRPKEGAFEDVCKRVIEEKGGFEQVSANIRTEELILPEPSEEFIYDIIKNSIVYDFKELTKLLMCTFDFDYKRLEREKSIIGLKRKLIGNTSE